MTTEPVTIEPCRKCGKGLKMPVYVITEGAGDIGPFGIRCARRALAEAARHGVTATLRHGHA